MENILYDLYYGGISPWEKPVNRNSEYSKEMKNLVELESKILALLNEKEKGIFEEFTKSQIRVCSFSTADGFIDGFRLGMKLAVEVLAAKE